MKITAIRYRKLVSGPSFENKAVEAEAVVEDGDAPEETLFELSQWVHAQLKGETTFDIDALRQDVRFMAGQRDQLSKAIATDKAELQRLRDDISAAKPKTPAPAGADDDDMPF